MPFAALPATPAIVVAVAPHRSQDARSTAVSVTTTS
jgi:hypothetical protein